MLEKITGVSVDVGGSGLRSMLAGASVKEHSNTIKIIDRDGFRVKESNENQQELFEVVESSNPTYKGIYAMGITGDSYSGVVATIDSQAAKTSSDVYYLQMIYGLATECLNKSLKELAEGANKQVIEETIYNLVITTCIPVKEHTGNVDCAEILKEKIEGTYKVEFPAVGDGITVNFRVEKQNVFVLPEGASTIPTIKEIGPEDISLVVDLGFVTMDLALFKGKQILGDYVVSAPNAGSTLVGLIRNVLIDAGYKRVSFDVAKRVLEKGTIKIGGAEEPVHEMVKKVKEIFVQNFVKPEIISLVNVANLGLQDITNVIPIGGPMQESELAGSMADMLSDYCGLENANMIIQEGNLRHVNILKAHAVLLLLLQRKGIQVS